jgi:K+-sensing histidine kinase KdpD
MMAVLSHEIRNPAHIISHSCNALAAQISESDPAYANVAAIRLSAENMHRLINDVINYNKMQKGALEIEYTVFALRPWLCAIVTSHQPLANVPLSLLIAPDVPAYIISDSMRLQQIIANGLTNACKFCAYGSIEVKAMMKQALSESGSTSHLCIHIIDTGPGIGTYRSVLYSNGCVSHKSCCDCHADKMNNSLLWVNASMNPLEGDPSNLSAADASPSNPFLAAVSPEALTVHISQSQEHDHLEEVLVLVPGLSKSNDLGGNSGSAAQTAKARGSGLGLPVARMLVSRMGGTLSLYRDAALQRTVFRVEMPVPPVELTSHSS